MLSTYRDRPVKPGSIAARLRRLVLMRGHGFRPALKAAGRHEQGDGRVDDKAIAFHGKKTDLLLPSGAPGDFDDFSVPRESRQRRLLRGAA